MSSSISRRLAAIVSADVVGYSSLVENDEAGTIGSVRALQAQVFAPTVANHGGRLFKTMGDGMLYEFSSIVAAVEAAITIQRLISERHDTNLRFRIGVHLGDVILDGDDLLGDGVNIAVRIEAKAEPGGVALSDEAFRQVKTKTKTHWRDGGEQALKNISYPVRIWHWSPDGDTFFPQRPLAEEVAVKPSIAVLPFQNMSGDIEQEFFADGLVEDVTTELSRYSGLFVTSRSSAFAFKGKNLDVPRIAQELGVSYILEGSVRRAAQRLRVTSQLIEAGADNHIWAQRFDRTVDDLFDIQDEITTSVVGIVINEIERAETTRASNKRVSDLNAWERLMKGLWHLERGTAEDNVKSQEIFRSEIKHSAGGASAHAWLLAALGMDLMYGFSKRKAEDILTEGLSVGRAAVGIDGNREITRAWLSVFLFIAGEHEDATAEARTAIRLNPNLALGHRALGYALAHSGPDHVDEACRSLDLAIKLGPRDYWTPMCHANKAMAHLIGKQHDASIACAKVALSFNPELSTAFRLLAAAHARSGQIELASQYWRRALAAGQIDLAAFKKSIFRVLKRNEDAEYYYGGLVLAGMDV